MVIATRVMKKRACLAINTALHFLAIASPSCNS
jgi:hypothetical protein